MRTGIQAVTAAALIWGVAGTASAQQIQQPMVGSYQLQQPLVGSYQLQQPLVGSYQLQQPLVGDYSQQPLVGTQPLYPDTFSTQPEQPGSSGY